MSFLTFPQRGASHEVVSDPDGHDPDRALLERLRTGDRSALEGLLVRHQERAYRVAIGIVRDPDDAADAVQSAFVKAIRGIDGFRSDARFGTWFLSIVINEARGGLRRQGRRREQALDGLPEPAAHELDAAERTVVRDEAARARRALAELPEKQRLAVLLRVDEGLSFREVAAATGSTEGAARVNYHHGIRRLRRMLDDEEGA